MRNQSVSSPRSTFQFVVARHRVSKLRLASCLLLVLCAFGPAAAQSQSADDGRGSAPPAVFAAATPRGARFIAPHGVVEMRLEVFSPAGERVFDSEFRRGGLLDWNAPGALQTGASDAPDGSYLCVVTLRELSGSLRQRHGLAAVQAGNVALRAATREELSVAQAQAWAASRETQALASLAQDGEYVALNIVSEQEARAMTVATHDGHVGQVTSTTGALTFHTGDVFTGRENEQMRITPEGRVGIGTDKPEAALDVVGALRVSEGVRFADGTSLNSTGGRLTVRDAAGDIVPAPNTAGTGTISRLAKWSETGGAGTLTDAAAAEADGLTIFGQNASGQVAPLFPTAANNHIVEVGATGSKSPLVLAGGSGLMEFWKDLGGGTGAPAAAVAFGMARPGLAATNDMVFSTYTPAAFWNERMRITTGGNLGVGTSTPAEKVEVAGNVKLTGTGNGVIFPDGTKQTSAPTGGVTGTGTTNTVPLWTGATALGNSVITQSGGNVGVGVAVPSAKLDVAGNIKAGGSLNGASATVVGSLTVGTTGTLVVDPGAGLVSVEGVVSVEGTVVVEDFITAPQYNIGADRVLSAPGTENVFVGAGAGEDHVNGARNSFFGKNAGASNVGGIDNSFFGRNAGTAATANNNSFFGSSAGAANTFGSANAFFGAFAGLANTTTCCNSFFGANSGDSNVDGFNNSFFGRNAGHTNTSGDNNTFVGYGTGQSNTTENDNTFIGANSNGFEGITNATAIGANASVLQSDSLVLGNGVKVGIGSSTPQEKLHVLGGNILIDSSGNGLILKSPNGATCAKLTISDAGALVTTVIPCP